MSRPRSSLDCGLLSNRQKQKRVQTNCLLVKSSSVIVSQEPKIGNPYAYKLRGFAFADGRVVSWTFFSSGPILITYHIFCSKTETEVTRHPCNSLDFPRALVRCRREKTNQSEWRIIFIDEPFSCRKLRTRPNEGRDR